MESVPTTFAVEGPVQAEVFVVWRAPDGLELTGPCGAAPWLIELDADEHPVDAVTRIVREVVGPPLLVHSTSWRREAGAVVLTFIAIIEAVLVGAMESRPIGRADLARGTATAAPSAIATASVLEHGLRHLAWLAQEDPVVAARLSVGWRSVLAAYTPEPFRNLA